MELIHVAQKISLKKSSADVERLTMYTSLEKVLTTHQNTMRTEHFLNDIIFYYCYLMVVTFEALHLFLTILQVISNAVSGCL